MHHSHATPAVTSLPCTSSLTLRNSVFGFRDSASAAERTFPLAGIKGYPWKAPAKPAGWRVVAWNHTSLTPRTPRRLTGGELSDDTPSWGRRHRGRGRSASAWYPGYLTRDDRGFLGFRPGAGAAREGTTLAVLEKTARAVEQSWGEERPGRLSGGGSGSLMQRRRCGESFHRWV